MGSSLSMALESSVQSPLYGGSRSESLDVATQDARPRFQRDNARLNRPLAACQAASCPGFSGCHICTDSGRVFSELGIMILNTPLNDDGTPDSSRVNRQRLATVVFACTLWKAISPRSLPPSQESCRMWTVISTLGYLKLGLGGVPGVASGEDLTLP